MNELISIVVPVFNEEATVARVIERLLAIELPIAREILVVTRNERLFEEQQLVLQRARELRLAHRNLRRETEHKDVLFHTIVHDLAVPLNSILGVLSLLSERPLDAADAKLIGIALQAATRERQ